MIRHRQCKYRRDHSQNHGIHREVVDPGFGYAIRQDICNRHRRLLYRNIQGRHSSVNILIFVINYVFCSFTFALQS